MGWQWSPGIEGKGAVSLSTETPDTPTRYAGRPAYASLAILTGLAAVLFLLLREYDFAAVFLTVAIVSTALIWRPELNMWDRSSRWARGKQ